MMTDSSLGGEGRGPERGEGSEQGSWVLYTKDGSLDTPPSLISLLLSTYFAKIHAFVVEVILLS